MVDINYIYTSSDYNIFYILFDLHETREEGDLFINSRERWRDSFLGKEFITS